MNICERLLVLDFGETIAAGFPREIQQNPRVLEVYLGVVRGAIMMLSVENLTVAYGNIRAVDNISFSVPEGGIVSLIGANGAGKSSTLRALSGLVPYGGSIVYNGLDLRRVPAHRIVGAGHGPGPGREGHIREPVGLGNLKLATWQRGAGVIPLTIIAGCSSSSPSLRSGGISSAAPSRAANSRCWPWPGRS